MLDHGYREFQQQIIDSPARWKVAVCHRRSGKTVLALDWLLAPARDPEWTGLDGNPYRGYFIAPYRNQAKGIGFDFLLQMVAGEEIMINRSELFVEFKNTGGRVQLLGSEGGAKHRGKLAHRCVFDEVAQIPPDVWRSVFRPMLADTKGEALFVGTPRGHGFFHDLFTMPERSDNWASWLLTADESGILDDEELADLQAEMPEAEYRREFLCDWDVGIQGAYFTAQLDGITNGERLLAGVVHDQSEVVWTSWALLPNDALAVCWWQMEGRTPVLIDSQRWVQAPIAEVVKAVQERPYVYAGHLFRIDGTQASDETTPFRMRQIRQLGLRGPIMPRREWADEVQIIRQFLDAASLANDQATECVEALRQVHAEWDEAKAVFSAQPTRDWTYDYAVAVSAFAAYWRRGKVLGRREPIDYPARRANG